MAVPAPAIAEEWHLRPGHQHLRLPIPLPTQRHPTTRHRHPRPTESSKADFVNGLLTPGITHPLTRGGGHSEARSQRSSRTSDPSPGQVPAEVNGWKVASVAEQCCALLDVGDLRFPRLPGAVAALLAAGADPDRHIYPAMRSVARRGVEGVGSVRYLAAAVRGLMREAA